MRETKNDFKLNPKSYLAECYRMVRTNLDFIKINQSAKVMMVTSCLSGEGKSTTVVNLAMTFSQAGKKTLVVDADLRGPRIHRILGIDNNLGLTHYFANKVSFEECVKEINPYFHVLTAGVLPPNPSEILASKAANSFFKNIDRYYDIVLIDTSPVILFSDASVLSSQVDGTIFVVVDGKTKKGSLKEARKILDQAGGRIIGVIRTRAKFRKKNNRSYQYERYYKKTRTKGNNESHINKVEKEG